MNQSNQSQAVLTPLLTSPHTPRIQYVALLQEIGGDVEKHYAQMHDAIRYGISFESEKEAEEREAWRHYIEMDERFEAQDERVTIQDVHCAHDAHQRAVRAVIFDHETLMKRLARVSVGHGIHPNALSRVSFSALTGQFTHFLFLDRWNKGYAKDHLHELSSDVTPLSHHQTQGLIPDIQLDFVGLNLRDTDRIMGFAYRYPLDYDYTTSHACTQRKNVRTFPALQEPVSVLQRAKQTIPDSLDAHEDMIQKSASQVTYSDLKYFYDSFVLSDDPFTLEGAETCLHNWILAIRLTLMHHVAPYIQALDTIYDRPENHLRVDLARHNASNTWWLY